MMAMRPQLTKPMRTHLWMVKHKIHGGWVKKEEINMTRQSMESKHCIHIPPYFPPFLLPSLLLFLPIRQNPRPFGQHGQCDTGDEEREEARWGPLVPTFAEAVLPLAFKRGIVAARVGA